MATPGATDRHPRRRAVRASPGAPPPQLQTAPRPKTRPPQPGAQVVTAAAVGRRHTGAARAALGEMRQPPQGEMVLKSDPPVPISPPPSAALAEPAAREATAAEPDSPDPRAATGETAE